MPRPTHVSPVRPRLQYDDLIALPREEFLDLLNSVDVTLLPERVKPTLVGPTTTGPPVGTLPAFPPVGRQVPTIAPLRAPVRNPLTSPLRRR